MDFVRSTWDIIWEAIGWFQICTFIDEWEEGVLLRRGKFSRTVGPGVAWHLPLGLDEITCLNVKTDSMELAEQVLTTKDKKSIVISVNLLWSIFDIKKCTIDVEDAADTLSDIALGFVHDLVEETTWHQIKTKAFRSELKRHIQRQARKFGISVSTVKVANLSTTRVYRLIT
jgi:regulator of protease activity HflC (stomatin/prohibitin superfamily)